MRIEMTIIIRDIIAEGYRDANLKAYNEMTGSLIRRRVLAGVGVSDYEDFSKISKVAREANKTFTVTLS